MATKEVDARNQIWFQQEGNTVNVGFTSTFLAKMDECWHILPAGSGLIREKDPLVAVETNDCLTSVRSPLAGTIVYFNDKATNFPDKLTEDDVIVSLKLDTKAKIAKPSPVRPNRAAGDGILGGRGAGEALRQELEWRTEAVRLNVPQPPLDWNLARPEVAQAPQPAAVPNRPRGRTR